MLKINFIRASDRYKFAVATIVEPIARILETYADVEVETDVYKAEDDAVNVYSFFDEGYLTEVGGLKGVTVHLPHGAADKDYLTAERMDMFDYCVVTGEYHRDKLITEGLSAERIILGGFTKFSVLNILDDTYSFRKLKPFTVLYAPTHGGDNKANLCSLEHSKNGDIVAELEGNGFEVESSLHPNEAEDHRCTTDLLIKADVVVSDCSSIIYEAWHLNKPVVFLDWMVKGFIAQHYPKSAENEIYTKGIGRHANNMIDAIKMIREAAKYGITYDEKDMLDKISSLSLRFRAPNIIAKSLATIGGLMK